MIKNLKLPLIVFFAALACMELWMVSAFGSYMGFERNNTQIFREVTRIMIPLVGLLGIFLLPRFRKFPLPPVTVIVCFSYLLVWGTFMILNATADSDLTNYIPTVYPAKERLVPALDGSHAVSASKGYVWELIGVMIFIVMMTRSAESRAWRHIVTALASCAIFVSIVGIVHKSLNIATVWGIPDISGPASFFAPFIYNANAAAIMNMGFPVILCLALQTQREKGIQGTFFGWTLAAGIVFVGILAAASKAGAIILIFQLLCFISWEFNTILDALRQRRRGKKMSTEKKFVLAAIATLFGALGLISVGYLNSRVQEFSRSLSEEGKADTIDGRLAIIRFTLEKSFDAIDPVWEGHGPGSFRHTIIYYMKPADIEVAQAGRFDETHSDPVQTIFEWGYLGALCWFTFGIGAVVRGAYLVFKNKVPPEDIHLVKAIVISLVGVGIHSCFDFPLSLLSIHIIAVAFCAVLWALYRDPKPAQLWS